MLACVDVDYRDGDEAVAACLVFEAWSDPEPLERHAVRVPDVEPYQPGAFFRRELPCVLAVLGQVERELEVVVVDGYVWLDGERPGLGAHLYEALGRGAAVVGVAKSAFSGANGVEVRRGDSARPLFVSAAGMDVAEAAQHVRCMHGPHRLPTLLKAVDRHARDA